MNSSSLIKIPATANPFPFSFLTIDMISPTTDKIRPNRKNSFFEIHYSKGTLSNFRDQSGIIKADSYPSAVPASPGIIEFDVEINDRITIDQPVFAHILT